MPILLLISVIIVTQLQLHLRAVVRAGQGGRADGPGSARGPGRGGEDLPEALPGARAGRRHGLAPVALLPQAAGPQHLHPRAAGLLLPGAAAADHDDQRPLLSTRG